MAKKNLRHRINGGEARIGSALAIAAMSIFALGAGASGSTAQASIAPEKMAGEGRTYRIPAGSMANALNTFADMNGLQLLYDAGVTERLQTSGLSGQYSVKEGLDRLLSGTRLSYRIASKHRTVSIVLAQNDIETQSDASGAIALPTVEVEANKEDGNGEGPGNSVGGAGLGGRFTGYTVDLETPAVAGKSDIPILQTPGSIQVVPRQLMDDQQAISVQDAIVGNVSGVQPSSDAFYNGFIIRGFDNSNVYRNDLRLGFSSNLETANLQSIEVLKGPAAMLFGRLEPGGIVNLVVKRPLDVPYYSIEEQTGSWGLTRTTIDATGPLTDDKNWLYRINLDYTHTNSFRNFVFDQNVFVAPTLTYHPIEQFRFNVDARISELYFRGGRRFRHPGVWQPARGYPDQPLPSGPRSHRRESQPPNPKVHRLRLDVRHQSKLEPDQSFRLREYFQCAKNYGLLRGRRDGQLPGHRVQSVPVRGRTTLPLRRKLQSNHPVYQSRPEGQI